MKKKKISQFIHELSAILLQIIFVFSLLEYDKMLGEEYTYPEWSTAVGWILTMSSILCIPTFIIYKFLRTPGGFKHVRLP